MFNSMRLSNRAAGILKTTRRSLSSHTSGPVPSITLFQYEICPFCNMNKALLSYTNTDYNTTEVNPLSKAEIKFSPDYRKVPIALVNGEQVNGSKEINEALLRLPYVIDNLSTKNDMPLHDFVNSHTAQKWENFARDELAPILYPNICRSIGESYQAFSYVKKIETFTGMQKVLIRGVGSLAMFFAASKIKSKRNITDERMALRDALTKWEDEGLGSRANSFGSKMEAPDMGDVCMYGVLKSVSGLLDEEVLGRSVVLKDWYLRMEEQVERK